VCSRGALYYSPVVNCLVTSRPCHRHQLHFAPHVPSYRLRQWRSKVVSVQPPRVGVVVVVALQHSTNSHTVPMQAYPEAAGQAQPPVYAQDGNAQHYAQQVPTSYAGTPPPQQATYAQPHPQPEPGMPPQQMAGTQYQTATPLANLQRGPAPADCPACGQRALTNTSFETGNTTHAWAFGLCCLCCLGCIPYLMSSMKDVQHKCGKCGVLLATWHRSGSTEVHIHS
jgi:lipopolysaccharide-induced tumor necrosis factor-alpha factor